MKSVISYIKRDIRKLGKEIYDCPKNKMNSELRAYLIARKNTLKEILTLLQKQNVNH